jgi:hypothetical protein
MILPFYNEQMKMNRKFFIIALASMLLCGFAVKTYKYRCPKCKLVQEFTQQGVKKCPNDGRIMIKMP